MNNRQKRTLAAIFESPLRSDVVWSDIESLVKALGGEVEERKGSAIAFALGGRRGHFHRPHPERVTDRGALRGVQTFLTATGFAPEDEA